jgi:hypothetical protein
MSSPSISRNFPAFTLIANNVLFVRFRRMSMAFRPRRTAASYSVSAVTSNVQHSLEGYVARLKKQDA